MLDQIVIHKLQPIPGGRVGIDKVVLSIPLIKDGVKDYATKFHLESEIYDQSVHHHHIKKFSKKGFSAVVGRYFAATEKRRILTIVVGVVWGTPYCQFVFNPNRLIATDWQTIQEILCFCFNYGLKELLEEGVIRKLELSIDFHNMRTASLVAMASDIKSNTNFKGTRYYGKRTSPLSLATYDKAKQLADVEGIKLPHNLTRIEARLVLPSLTLLDLAEGKGANPWDRIFRGIGQRFTQDMREILH